MQYLRQFMIICAISLSGEVLSFLIHFPIPASIYGIVLLFSLLVCGHLKVESIKEVSSFLLAIMPVMFIAPAVGLMDLFSLMRGSLAAYVTITIVSTIVVMAVTGRVTQHLIRIEKNAEDNSHA